MVYRGKPSAACAECRKLRSRCDKKLPACGQCIKAGRGCSGYRNVVDLMFLDESSRVVTQNKRRVPSKQTALNKYKASTDLYGQAKGRESSETPFHLAGFVMYQPLDHLGVTYFMSNFVVDDPNMSLIYYLPNLYAKTGFSDPALWQMCAAVGLVSLANKSQREDMFNVATNNYSAAIRSINSALLCPKKAAQDSILASIFMAAMFEALIIPRDRGMDNCCTHLAGAVSVAHLILKQGMETDVTMQQCTALVKTVIMNCWVQDIALPPHFAEFKRLVETKAAHVSIHDVFLDINMELLHFKKEYQYSTKHSPAVIIEKALEVDATLEEFERKMECQIPFETIQSSTVGEELAYNRCFHVYPQHLHAHLWNNVRASRVRLHQVILRQSQALEPSPGIISQQKTSIATAISQTAEMLASIPQLAGYLQDLGLTFIPPGDHHESPTGYPTQQHTTSIPIPEYNFHSLCHILYQLYIYGSEPCLPQKMRDWIQQRISWMEHHANPIDLAGLQETVRRQIWPVSLVDKEELRNATFQNEANTLFSSNIEAASQRDGTTAAVGFRLGGNDFLHRQAVSAGGMHSCSSVACKICDV